MFGSHFIHYIHQKQVVIHGQVGLLVNGRQLKLIGSHLVVSGFKRNTQFISLVLEFFHKFHHSFGNGAEIMVVELLIFGGLVPHQGSSAHHQIGARTPESFVHQKEFLFPTQVRVHFFDFGIKETASFGGRFTDSGNGLDQRRFIVERFAGVGNKNSGYAKGVVHYKGRRRWIPGAVAPRFESIAYAAARKTRSIGFLLNKQAAVEGFDHPAAFFQLYQGIVFLGRSVGKRMKPMGIMRHTQFHGPDFHSLGQMIGHGYIQGFA